MIRFKKLFKRFWNILIATFITAVLSAILAEPTTQLVAWGKTKLHISKVETK